MPTTRSIIPNSDDIEEERRHYELLLASRARHPELVLTRRPTVEELLQRAACLLHFQGREVSGDLADLGRFTHLEAEDPIFFKHRVGDGFHYINNNALIFPSGKKQLGDTSEGCIFVNIFLVLFKYRIKGLDRWLWNLAYPEDYMANEDLAYVMCAAWNFRERFDADMPENILAVLQDLRAIRCDRMAEVLFEKLRA